MGTALRMLSTRDPNTPSHAVQRDAGDIDANGTARTMSYPAYIMIIKSRFKSQLLWKLEAMQQIDADIDCVVIDRTNQTMHANVRTPVRLVGEASPTIATVVVTRGPRL